MARQRAGYTLSERMGRARTFLCVPLAARCLRLCLLGSRLAAGVRAQTDPWGECTAFLQSVDGACCHAGDCRTAPSECLPTCAHLFEAHWGRCHVLLERVANASQPRPRWGTQLQLMHATCAASILPEPSTYYSNYDPVCSDFGDSVMGPGACSIYHLQGLDCATFFCPECPYAGYCDKTCLVNACARCDTRLFDDFGLDRSSHVNCSGNVSVGTHCAVKCFDGFTMNFDGVHVHANSSTQMVLKELGLMGTATDDLLVAMFHCGDDARWHGRSFSCDVPLQSSADSSHCPMASGADVGGNGSPSTPGASGSTLAFSPALGSHMVLQRDTSARIWGTASAGDVVTVEVASMSRMFSGIERVSARASANGSWYVDLKPRPASSGLLDAALISAMSRDHNTSRVLEDVLWGDVWGCHGQSNMVFGLHQDMNAASECAAANAFPHIRVMTLTQSQPWSVASCETVCKTGTFHPFSAVCWYFGKNLYESMNGSVPSRDKKNRWLYLSAYLSRGGGGSVGLGRLLTIPWVCGTQLTGRVAAG